MDAGLRIEIKNRKPIELSDFTTSLWALANEFRKQMETEAPEIAAADVRLYVKSVQSGSIIAEVIAIAPQALQLVSYANSVMGFYKHVKNAYDYLAGVTDEKPPLDKSSYENLSGIVEPVAKESGSQLNIGVLNGDLFLTLDSLKANAIQNKARKEIEALAEPTKGLHEKVLLYWYQARGDAKSKTGDRAIIESISPFSVKTICANDLIKAQMILEDANPFKEAYVVDVMVETIRGKPALYKVLAVHDKFQREDF